MVTIARPQWVRRSLLASALCLCGFGKLLLLADEPTPPAEPGQALKSALHNRLLIMNVSISQRAPSVDLFSKRGDIHFYLGQFAKAVEDYRQMVKLDPSMDARHWRLGIALFYAGDAQAAAAQFDRYHGFDDVDRENGIWRYFCHYRAFGKAAARQQLLKYNKDDREPFGDLYQLFAGTLATDQILRNIADAKISDDERQKRLFYAELYLGLNAAVEGASVEAESHLQAAVANEWPRTAGYGPEFMWHVGRVQLELLQAASPRKVAP